MIGRKTKMPKIFVTEYIVQPKSADQISKAPDRFYYDLACELYHAALIVVPAVSHNSSDVPGGQHEYCDLKKDLEHRVQHSECPQHTKYYLLPNDIGVRINPLIMDVVRGTEAVNTGSWRDWHLRDKHVDEICVEVSVRTTKEKQQKYLEQLLSRVGVIMYKEKKLS